MTENNHQTEFEKEEKKIEETISKIKHRIAVFSGKGGVGKTTVSINLACAFQTKNFDTGLLDADITGPNVSKMLGIETQLIYLDEKIIPYEKYGIKSVSVAGAIPAGKPIIWRGPLRSKLINQFIGDVDWGNLNILIADLPPGTGDEILTIAQSMKPDYAVIVTTPQEVSIIDAERALNMAKQMNIKNIGVIENMAGLICPHCGNEIDLFGTGGGERLAKENDVEFLGSIPIVVKARKLSDEGTPIVIEDKGSEISEVFNRITEQIIFKLKK